MTRFMLRNLGSCPPCGCYSILFCFWHGFNMWRWWWYDAGMPLALLTLLVIGPKEWREDTIDISEFLANSCWEATATFGRTLANSRPSWWPEQCGCCCGTDSWRTWLHRLGWGLHLHSPFGFRFKVWMTIVLLIYITDLFLSFRLHEYGIHVSLLFSFDRNSLHIQGERLRPWEGLTILWLTM